MMTWGTSTRLTLILVLLGTACGESSPANTVATKEDALKIRAAAESALSRLPGGNGEGSCPDGGTVKGKFTIEEITEEGGTMTQEVTFDGCVSQGVTLDGSLVQEAKGTGAGKFTTTHTGHVDTSLGSCNVDLKGTFTRDSSGNTTGVETSGKLCGFDTP